MERTILAERANYVVSAEFETVYLMHKADPSWRETVIGDFYGDPTAAAIDEHERLVVMVGCGVIVYYLNEPFEPYRYDTETTQWTDVFREPAKTLWIESVVQRDANTFVVEVEANSEAAGSYTLTIEDLQIRKLHADELG